MTEKPISKWKGIWKDDRGRFIHIDWLETPEGLAKGYIIGDKSEELYHYREGTNVLDGSKLMERKRGEEKGWPI
jgi:hypothetical protein